MKYDPPTPSARNEVKTRTSTSIRGELEPNPPSPLRRGQSGRLINNSPSSSSHATSTGGCSNATPPNSSASIDRQGSSVVRGSEGQTCSESTNKSVDSKSETSHELLKSSTKTSPCQVQTNQGRRRESAKSRLGEGKLGSDEPRRGSLSGSVRKTTLSQNGKDLTIYSNSSVNGQGEMRQREPGVSSTQRPHKSDARLKHTQSETLLPKRLSTTSEKRRSSGIGSNVVPSRPVNVRNPNPSKGLGDIGRKSSPAPRHINSNTSSKKMSSNGSSSSEPLSLAERSRNISHDSNKTNLGATKKDSISRKTPRPRPLGTPRRTASAITVIATSPANRAAILDKPRSTSALFDQQRPGTASSSSSRSGSIKRKPTPVPASTTASRLRAAKSRESLGSKEDLTGIRSRRGSGPWRELASVTHVKSKRLIEPKTDGHEETNSSRCRSPDNHSNQGMKKMQQARDAPPSSDARPSRHKSSMPGTGGTMISPAPSSGSPPDSSSSSSSNVTRSRRKGAFCPSSSPGPPGSSRPCIPAVLLASKAASSVVSQQNRRTRELSSSPLRSGRGSPVFGNSPHAEARSRGGANVSSSSSVSVSERALNPSSDLGRRGQQDTSSPSLWRKALIINKFMTLTSSTSPTSKRRMLMKSAQNGTASKSGDRLAKKPVERLIKPGANMDRGGGGGGKNALKLIPRRDFILGKAPAPAEDRIVSVRNIRNGPSPPAVAKVKAKLERKIPAKPDLFPVKMSAVQMSEQGCLNRKILKLFSARTAVDMGITYSKMKVFLERWKKCERKWPLSMVEKLLQTIQSQTPIRDMLQRSKEPDNFRYSEFFPADLKYHHCPEDGYVWIGSVNDPLLPDPAYDRKFAAFWMTKLSQLPCRGNSQQLKLDSQETRSILRKLDKIVAFPEETALLLKAYEGKLFKAIGMRTLLSSVVHSMSKKTNSSLRAQPEDYDLFQKLVSHFYLVCEWIVQLIISQPSNTTRREALSCILRFAQASWNIGNFNGTMEILLGLRSPALKPFWISLSGSDADQLFSRLFRKLFCFNSREYKKALRAACIRKAAAHGGSKRPTGLSDVVPAYLLHLTSLSSALTESQGSCLVSLSEDGCVEVLTDFHGENRFLRRIYEPEHPYTSALQAPIKKRMLQSTLNTVHEVWSGSDSSLESDDLDAPEKRHSSLVDSPILHKSTAHHGVTMVKPPNEALDTIALLHAGTTVLHFEPDSHQVLPVFLKLEHCNGTVTWCRPPWSDPRRASSTSFMSSSPDDNGTTLDTIEEAVSPGLRLKYTNRSGESLAYTDEGYIDLMHMKDLSLSDDIYNFPENIRLNIHRTFQSAVEPTIMRIVFGSSLSENRTVHFLCTPEVASKWFEILPTMSRAIKNEDPRIVWLKDQYLFLFFQDDLCMGPLAADAIKVFGGRSWSLTGMLKDRSHKGSWKGVANNPRTKKKSYGNIHSINDRGIHEIYETFGGVANGPSGGSVSNLSSLGGASAPASPWSSPLMGRKSIAVSSPLHVDKQSGKLLPMQSPLTSHNVGDLNLEDARKLNCLRTGSITHGSELSFMEFLDLFKSFSLRLRKDIRTLFANHSVCNVTSPDEGVKDWMNISKRKEALLRLGGRSGSSDSPGNNRKRELLCSLTRNSSMDLTDFKSRSDKKKVFDAMAAASIFNNSAGVDTSRARMIPMDAFCHFLEHFQKESHSEMAVKELIELHEPDPVLRAHNQLSFEGFARYLMDSANSAIDLNDNEAGQDLDQPLSRYYVATSHNTYLVGHQLKGLSSVQLYREILLTGCRCVELDCWDGDDGNPIIYHGHTLTTKISFQEVVQTIAESAFISSPLPVILSIENHCSIPQQQKMAAIFKELLGDCLVTAPIAENESQLPSPNSLRYRIILKNKKLRSGNGIGSTKSLYRTSTFDEQGGCNSHDMEEEYDSDYGEEDFDDEMQDEYNEQNLSAEDYHQSLRNSGNSLSVQNQTLTSTSSSAQIGGGSSSQQQRPRTLSISPSLQLQQQLLLQQQHQQQQQATALASSSSSKALDYDQTTGKKKKENNQIARELSDLVIYCQSVKFKGFGKSDHVSSSTHPTIQQASYISDSPANRKRPDIVSLAAGGALTPVSGPIQIGPVTPIPALQGGRRTGLKSLESTPSSSSGSLAGSVSSVANGVVPGSQVIHTRAPLMAQGSTTMSSNPSTATLTNLNTSLDISSPIYQCSSLHESRAKTLCRKHSQRMLEHTENQLVRVYPAGMRIDSSNFNPITVWSCGIQMVAMNYQTSDANLHMHNAMFAGTKGFVLKPQVMWNPSHILYQRFLPNSKSQEGLHITHISLTVLSGQYVCRENYGTSPIVEIEVLGIPRDCCKFKTKMISRNALNPIWEETFEIEVHLPELAFIRFTVLDVGSNMVTAQRVVPVTKLRQGYRHLRLHNELDQPLPLSQLFLCSQILDGDLVEDDDELKISISKSGPGVSSAVGATSSGKSDQPGRKRMSFLVVHDISEHSPYAILKVPENATTRDVIRQAIAKAGTAGNEHEYVLLEEVLVPSANGDDFITAPPTQQRMVGMDERPLHLRNKWKSDSKFVLKRIGSDPSWRARLGNMIQENNNQAFSHHTLEETSLLLDSEDNGAIVKALKDEPSKSGDPIEDKEQENGSSNIKRDVDNFLVCIFNVSSKVSYSILQVPRTSTATDVITLALSKCRRGEEDENKPEKFVLVEETDPPPVLQNYAFNNSGANKKAQKGKRKRVLDAQENVYLVQLAWKGAGRLILEEKEKLLKEGQFYLDVPNNPHLNVCETQSDPLSGLALAGKVSPRLRRSSKIIASGVRRISRSFYGSDANQSHSNNPLGMNKPQILRPKPKQRRMTTVAAGGDLTHASALPSDMAGSAGPGRTPSRRRQRSGDARLDGHSRRDSGGEPIEGPESLPILMLPPIPPQETIVPADAVATANGNGFAPNLSTAAQAELGEDLKSRKLSKVNLRKLKIW